MHDDISAVVCGKLDALGIGYRRMTHPPVMTIEECAPMEKALGAHMCKNVFLQNRQGTEFFLLLMRGDKMFRTAEVSKKLGKARLSFGSAEKLYEYLHLKGGAVSPLGLLFDKGHNVQLVVDRELAAMDALCFHPCVNTKTVRIAAADFFDVFLPHTGHAPVLIDIGGRPDEG